MADNNDVLEQAFGVIDYAPYQQFLDGGKKDLKLFAQFRDNVMDVLPRSGSARIKNAPIMGFKDRVMKMTKDFFSLDLETKKRYVFPHSGDNRGYIPYGAKKVQDIKEFFHIDRSVHQALKGTPYEEIDDLISAADMDKQMEIPSLIDGYREAAIEFTQKASEMGNAFFEIFADYFELDQEEVDHLKKGNSVLRMIHYPPYEDREVESIKGATRAQAHADISAMTFLLTSDQPGLQVVPKDVVFDTFGTTFVPKAKFDEQIPSDKWVSVPASTEYCFMNIGRTLEIKSNGILPATIHRVIKMEDQALGNGKMTSRYSVPFFQHIGWNMPLTTWPKAVELRDGIDYFKQKEGTPTVTVKDYVLDSDTDKDKNPIPLELQKRPWIEPSKDKPVPVYRPS